MTPAQLTELRAAIPGDWKQDFDVGRETVTWFMPIGDGANLYAWIGDFNCNRWETDGDRTLSVEFTAGGSYQVTAGTFFDAARLLRESGGLPSGDAVTRSWQGDGAPYVVGFDAASGTTLILDPKGAQ